MLNGVRRGGYRLVPNLARLLPVRQHPQPMWPLMLWSTAERPVRMQYALALCAAVALSGCASKYARVPARLDLAPYGRIAIVTFSADQANSGLSTMGL